MSAAESGPCVYEHPAMRKAAGDSLRPGGLAVTERALSVISPEPGAKVLDIGCGPGATLGLLKSRGYAAVGLDRSGDFLREALGKAPVVRADGLGLPFRDSGLDAVFSECVLSLLSCKAAALKEFSRVLRPGGLLYISDLHREAPAGQAEQCGQPKERAKACIEGALPLPRLRSLLDEAGFELLHEEDHTRELKELAARLVLAGGPSQAFWPDCASKPGYVRLISRKRGQQQGKGN